MANPSMDEKLSLTLSIDWVALYSLIIWWWSWPRQTLTKRQIQKQRHTDKDKYKIPPRPNVCFIFQKQGVQGFMILYWLSSFGGHGGHGHGGQLSGAQLCGAQLSGAQLSASEKWTAGPNCPGPSCLVPNLPRIGARWVRQTYRTPLKL